MSSRARTLWLGVYFVVNLIARQPGLNGNNIGYTATTASSSSTGTPTEAATAAGSRPGGWRSRRGTGAGDPGEHLWNTTWPTRPAFATPNAKATIPTNFSGVEVYFDGIRSPILYVSPTQINTQLPFDVSGSNGVSAFVRTVHNDGSITATNAIGVPVVQENPGIFAAQWNRSPASRWRITPAATR